MLYLRVFADDSLGSIGLVPQQHFIHNRVLAKQLHRLPPPIRGRAATESEAATDLSVVYLQQVHRRSTGDKSRGTLMILAHLLRKSRGW